MKLVDLLSVSMLSVSNSWLSSQLLGSYSLYSDGIVIMIGDIFLASDREDASIFYFFIYWWKWISMDLTF